MANTYGSEPYAARLEGSSPSLPTIISGEANLLGFSEGLEGRSMCPKGTRGGVATEREAREL